MFKNLRNSYYFGKAGKADYTVDDLPTTRWQLFWVTLRTRLGSLMRVNMLYMLVFVPAIVVMMIFTSQIFQLQNFIADENGQNSYARMLASGQDLGDQQELITQRAAYSLTEDEYYLLRNNRLMRMLLWLIPCIAVTGPFTAGVSYLTRNWSRDEHAFAWSDFKDALKDNWKQALPVSVITGILPFIVYMGVFTYRELAAESWFYVIPEALVILAGVLWSISVTYMYPLMVSYELRFSDLIRNAFLLAVARLPQSTGIRLLHCMPCVLAFALSILLPYNVMPYVFMLLFAWYLILGFMMSRFVTSSYCNAVFDRFINPRIEGAKVGRGLHREEDDEEEADPEDPAGGVEEKRED